MSTKILILICILLFSGCDFGLDYQSASNYCKDRYVFVDKQINKIESSEFIPESERDRYDKLIVNPLKICYMSAVICSINCYNLNADCYDSFYNTHQYCDNLIKNLPKIY